MHYIFAVPLLPFSKKTPMCANFRYSPLRPTQMQTNIDVVYTFNHPKLANFVKFIQIHSSRPWHFSMGQHKLRTQPIDCTPGLTAQCKSAHTIRNFS